MTDNIAVLEGYTDEWTAYSVAREFPILVKPGTDLTGEFRAWDIDQQGFVMMRGWKWRFVQYVVDGESYADRDLAIEYANTIYKERGIIVAVEERRTP